MAVNRSGSLGGSSRQSARLHVEPWREIGRKLREGLEAHLIATLAHALIVRAHQNLAKKANASTVTWIERSVDTPRAEQEK